MHNSSSVEQQRAADVIFNQMCADLNLDPQDFLISPIIPINSERTVSIRPDFYSNKERIIGEIHAHIGKLKPSQFHKISADILKMLLYEKSIHTSLRKMIVICSDEEYAQLSGHSYVSEAIRQFGIELVYARIGQELRDKLLCAQERQKMVNV